VGYIDSMNLYQAFGMNPVNFTDPYGLYTDYYWEAKVNKNRKKGPIDPNPADEMTRAALGQHAKNTAVNFGLYAIATEVPIVGPAFVAGYATRQVGEGYVGAVKQRWNDVSVFDSGASKFLTRAASPFTGLWDLISGGPRGMYQAVTDSSLSGPEVGTLLMNSYNQTAWTAVGLKYGLKLIRPKKYQTTPMMERYSGEETGSVWGSKVKYLSEIERQSYRLKIKDGKVYDSSGKLFDTTDASSFASGKGNAIFVMDELGNIYASKAHPIGKFHHSSFMSGQPVAAAGEIAVKNGVITSITRRSGHYQPTSYYQNQFLYELVVRGVDLMNIVLGDGFQ
jgi:hypothetical protein